MKIKWFPEADPEGNAKKCNQIKQWLIHEPVYYLCLTTIIAIMLGSIFKISIFLILPVGYCLVLYFSQILVPNIDKSNKMFPRVSILYFIYQLVLIIVICSAFMLGAKYSIFDFAGPVGDLSLFAYGIIVLFFICCLIQLLLSRLIKYYDSMPDASSATATPSRSWRKSEIIMLIAIVILLILVVISADSPQTNSYNPRTMSLVNYDGQITVSGYIRNGKPVYHDWTANLAGLENLSSSEIDRINHFLIATFKLNQDDDQNNDHNITLFPVCAAIDEKGNLNILYHNNDGKVAVLNDDLRQLLQK